MAVPKTREELKQYCLRKLGYPLIEINVSDDQLEDRIDEALQYYVDYHFDATDRVYYKYIVQETDFPGAAKSIKIIDGGTGYSNTDTIIFNDGEGSEATIETNNSGTIQTITITAAGNGHSNTSTVSVNTTTGSGAILNLIPGDGSIEIPENIMGVISLFPISDVASAGDILFDVRYQIAVNELYTLNNVSLVPYYMARQHLSLLSEILTGRQPVRFSRHMNKVYIDMDWRPNRFQKYIILECYQVIDPNEYTDVWGDRWLQRYATAKIKYQWGTNLTKFTGMVLPGGVQFNGEKILDDAAKEIEDMEQEMITSYSLPAMDFWG